MDAIDGFTDEDDRFIFSREYSRLEYYECFHDPSSKKLISGKELIKLEHEKDWSEEQRKIWLYFYRPYKHGDIIGKKQKIFILDKESSISILEEKINTYNILKILFLILTLYFSYLSLTVVSFFIPIITLLISGYFFLGEKEILNKISYLKNDIFTLNKEINYLLQQQDEMKNFKETNGGVNNLFWGYLKKLENQYIYKLPTDDMEKTNEDFYKSVKQKAEKYHDYHDYPTFPVIPSWGLLQQSKNFNPNTHKHQSTGIKIASKDIKERIATWRKSTYGKPIFRLWYIQFLFFHNKSITVQSFYYDFITRKKYGENLEIYQYNHITNYSYTDEDISYMNSDPLMKEINLPRKLTKNIFCDEVKTLSFSSASGSHYRCVIPDNDVINGLNEWLKSDEAKEKLRNKEDNTISPNEEEEILSITDQYDGLIATLAWQSFKQLKEKVAQFSLIDDSHIQK